MKNSMGWPIARLETKAMYSIVISGSGEIMPIRLRYFSASHMSFAVRFIGRDGGDGGGILDDRGLLNCILRSCCVFFGGIHVYFLLRLGERPDFSQLIYTVYPEYAV